MRFISASSSERVREKRVTTLVIAAFLKNQDTRPLFQNHIRGGGFGTLEGYPLIDMSWDRRRFLATLGAATLSHAVPGGRGWLWAASPVAFRYRREPPYEAYRQFIEAGQDEFPDEAKVMRTADSVTPPPRSAKPLWFHDITAAAFSRAPEAREQLSRGVPYWAAALDPATGIDIYGNNGIAVGDIDNDGVDEVYVCQPGGLPNRLLKWKDGAFADITAAAGVDLFDATSCALFLDLRNLGRQDLVVLRSSGPLLFLNDGTGKFTMRADAFRFERPPQGSFTGMAAADYDRDGKLDLYLCCYSFFQSEAQYLYPVPYHDAQNGPPNFLFRNELDSRGRGSFQDVTAAAGLDENNNRYSFAPAWCDYDASGWPSLYVANDFGRNNLYRNRGGKFKDVAGEAGVEDLGPGMSACWFDDDGDGRPDLYVANMWTAPGQRVVNSPAFRNASTPQLKEAYRRHTKGNSLYRNFGGGKFVEAGERRGVEMGRWAWSATAHDFDNDGREEILIACGMLTGHREPDLMSFFWRQVVAQSPVTAQAASKYEGGWNAINQFIREGYSWNGQEANVFYAPGADRYRDASSESGVNVAADTRAFAVTDLDGTGCLDLLLKNRLGPQLQVFENRRGRDAQRLVLSLEGTASNRDAVGARVRVDGHTQWLAAGSGYLSQHTKRLHFGLGERKRAERVTITWPSGRVQEVGPLEAGSTYRVVEGKPAERGKALAAAAPPRPEGELAGDNLPRLRDTWFADPMPLPDRRTGPGLVVIREADLSANADLAAAYSLFRRYLFEYRAPLELPLALLVDAKGQARKIYSAVPEDAVVAADLARLEKPQPIPYRGFSADPPTRDYFKLGLALLWSGYGEQALPYLEASLKVQASNARTLVLVSQIHLEAGRLDEAERHAEAALRNEPANAEGSNQLGGVAAARGNYEGALGHYARALAIKPDLVHTLLNAGQAANKLERWEAAEQYYRQALAVEPLSAEAANGLGLAFARQNKAAEAKTYLQKAIELKPDFGTAINNLAVLYLQQGQINDAVAALEYGVKVSPGEEVLYLNLGRVYVQQGNRDKAREVMRALLAAKPGNAVATKALADLDR